ncbi:MAG: hypothetical protein M0R02_09385 [Bacteroidales bacterium]|nr:hypothetical protein [Bacteroidales bacterium]
MNKYSLIKGLIHESINANPESWRLFFNKYQIPQTNPEKGIITAYQKHGNAVIKDLNNLLITKIAAFGGLLPGDKIVSITDEEWTKILEGLGKIIPGDILSNNKADNTDTEDEKITKAEIEQKAIEAKKRKKRNLIIGFGAACIIIIIVFIVIKHQS